MEQILASHPAVFGGGELTFVGDLVKKFAEWSGIDAPFPRGMADIGGSALSGAARWNLEQVALPAGVSQVRVVSLTTTTLDAATPSKVTVLGPGALL